MINISLESIDESVLISLIDDKVPEGKNIEYKEKSVGAADADRKEFLADVSSFANTSGGLILFGIKAIDGIPVKLTGLEINGDKEILRLENLVRDGIEPRIPGIAMRTVTISSGSIVLLIKIPRSWSLPHMVSFKGNSRFYSRNSVGKYPLDVGELRDLFAISETIYERVRNFRSERLAQIIAGETPIPIPDSAKIVLHLMPLNSFDPATKYDLSSFGEKSSQLRPIRAVGWGYRYNFDGFVTYNLLRDSPLAYTYLQIFRSGIVEAVETGLLSVRQNEQKVIPSEAFEGALIDYVGKFLSIQKSLLGAELPIVLTLSLVSVTGYTMTKPERAWPRETYLIEKNHLVLPEILIDFIDKERVWSNS